MSAEGSFDASDLLDALAEADVLDTFRQLPGDDQDRFWGWVGMARDRESHWRRIHALVLALRTGPFQPTALRAQDIKRSLG